MAVAKVHVKMRMPLAILLAMAGGGTRGAGGEPEDGEKDCFGVRAGGDPAQDGSGGSRAGTERGEAEVGQSDTQQAEQRESATIRVGCLFLRHTLPCYHMKEK